MWCMLTWYFNCLWYQDCLIEWLGNCWFARIQLYLSLLTLGVSFLSPTGHGNHKEDSPFLKSADAASKKNDFYDRNLALFEVCCFYFLIFLWDNRLKLNSLISLSLSFQEELDIRPKVSSLLSRLVNYTNITQGAKEHEEEESPEASRSKTPKVRSQGTLRNSINNTTRHF